jgi:hypothetical protein
MRSIRGHFAKGGAALIKPRATKDDGLRRNAAAAERWGGGARSRLF